MSNQKMNLSNISEEEKQEILAMLKVKINNLLGLEDNDFIVE
jgi:DNA-directed RNA polymerase subunit H (RpoH/RPB5)